MISAATMSLEDKIRLLVVQVVGCEDSKITPSANLFDDLGADSLDQMEIIVTIEDSFDISIPDAACETLTTVGAINEYVRRQIEKRMEA